MGTKWYLKLIWPLAKQAKKKCKKSTLNLYSVFSLNKLSPLKGSKLYMYIYVGMDTNKVQWLNFCNLSIVQFYNHNSKITINK